MDPDLFEHDLHAIPTRLELLAASLESHSPWTGLASHRPLLTGMGSSAYAARTAAGWLRADGVEAIVELASTDPGWPGGPGHSAVLISASGGSAETLERADRLHAGTQQVALVNREESLLASHADVVVPMLAGDEVGGVACRTYRHTLALLHALGKDPALIAQECRHAADLTRALLTDSAWLDAIDEALSPAETTYWIAPESRIGSALQSALMVREIPRRRAVACETGDWSHVDVYLTLTTDYRCVMFTGSRWDSQAADWMRTRGSLVVSTGDPLGVPGEIHLPMPGSPITRMLAEPLVAELLALRWWRRAPVEVP
ncbi:MAG: SIS domain-containing protein [Candidatus Nanopelagicales bacterium]